MSLGGSKGKSSSSYTKNQSISGSQLVRDTSTQQKIIDAQTEQNLRAGQAGALSNVNYFTPSQAKADSKIAVDEAVRGVMQQYLPELNQQVAGSGMYGSTTGRQMQENLATRAAATAALTGLETTKEYASLSAQAAQTIGALAGEMGYTTKSTNEKYIEEEQTMRESGTGKAKESGASLGLSFS